MKKEVKKEKITATFIFECLGIMVAAFIPVSILLLENGVEIRIDRLVIINDLLSFKWFFGLLFALIFIAIIKKLIINGGKLTSIINIISFLLLIALLVCSFMTCKNTIAWLNDVPVSLSTDISYTSNPTLDSILPMDRTGFWSLGLKDIAGYKKKARIAYINSASSAREKELRWEIFFNDADSYKYEGGNDFWIYVKEYYTFLGSLSDGNMDVALRGFENISAHISDIGVSVDDHTDCGYVPSTLLQLKYEKAGWRSELWSGLVSRYIAVALTDPNVIDDTRTCWLGSLPDYLSDVNNRITDKEKNALLAKKLYDSFNSFEVQNSQYRAAFYSDVPQYIVDFYSMLSNTSSPDGLYEYIKNMKR